MAESNTSGADGWYENQPLLSLYVTGEDKEGSMKAFENLKELNVGFTVEQAVGESIGVGYGGRIYHGLESIAAIANALRSFEAALIQGASKIQFRHDSGDREMVRKQARKELEFQHVVAEKRLRELLSAG